MPIALTISALHKLTFARQLALAVTLGVLGMALLSSIATSWQGSRQVRETLARQGEQLAATVAAQSRLALLYSSGENATPALVTALAFPDVKGVEIRSADGHLLIAQGTPFLPSDEPGGGNLPREMQKAYLEAEDDRSWRFVSPVFAGEQESSPFEMLERSPEMIGYVRVVQSKATLEQLVSNVFAINLAISLCVAFAFLAVIRALTGRLTRPLIALSQTMARAEAGESGMRAVPAGPRDIIEMAAVFNRMMDALEEREADLRAARDSALQFGRMKAEFAATVSHEIRTPLNGVVGALDMLKTTALPTRQREFAEIAWESSQYLLDLVNNILDFSKLDAGKVELEQVNFDVVQLVEEVVDLLAPQAHSKGIEVGYTLADAAPTHLCGDPRRLRQALVNLLGNAVKFTRSGEVAVEIAPAVMADGSAGVRIEVSDTGIGIDDEVRDRIFDSFTQADTSTTRHFGGTGLGLSITRQLVQLMGGNIGVNTQAGGGSCFWIVLPGAVTTSWSMEGAELAQRALVIDGAEVVRTYLARALPTLGYAADCFCTAGAALASIRPGARVDVVLLDAGLVSAEGGDLLQRLSGALMPWPRLVLMHRLGSAPAVAPGTLGGEIRWLVKPLRRERLALCLEPASAGAVATASVDGRRWRVLIVEDNRTNQTIAARMLAMLGCDAEIADGGETAIRRFRQQPWNLILMDCNMPDFDGYQTTAAIRSLEGENGLRTPIVAMTANAQPADIEKCLAAGMDDHVAKPLTLATLTARLRRWVSPAVEVAEETPPAPLIAEPLDREIFGKLREMLGEMIDEAVTPFLEDMPVYLEEMADACSAGAAEPLRRAAHAVKGAAGNLGAAALAAVAREIEELASAGSLDPCGELLSRINAEYALARNALLSEIGGVTGAVYNNGDGARVLIVDDDRSTRSALRLALQRSGFSIEEAADGQQALELIAARLPDLILMDALMPVMDGFATCARLQEHPIWREVPVLMITALEDNHSIERAFAAGASDYITKPIHLAVVNQRVHRVVEANRAARNVRRMAYNDLLTGLPNRLLFTDRLARAMERSRGNGRPVALLYLDLDRFKYVNDTLGHEIGDRLLIAAAGRLRTCVRADDCVARLGGDEFAVLIEELSSEQGAASTAQKIGRALGERFDIEGHEIYVSSSVGITLFPGDGDDVSTLLRHADTAMYRAKKAGGGFQFFERGMEESMSAQVRTENALRRALERDELVVYYQPKAHAGTGRLMGMEALLRWRHPQRGIVSPLEFIPLAEETGLIVPIGEWILREACRQTKEWIDRGAGDLRIAVNLSGVQLKQGGFSDMVVSVAEQTGLQSRNLILEITESVLMENAQETVALLQRLNERGINFSIDDFGTGYSSLSYLKRFPVEILKIDRSFVRDVTENPDDAAIVTGIIALAHSLRLKVVAEGVETEAQRAFLERLDCDYIQGYLLSEPLPAEEFAARFLVKMPADQN